MKHKYLDDDDFLVISIPLAQVLGINASIALRRLRHWLKYNEQDKSKAETHFRDGRWWCWNSYIDWQKDMPIFSDDSIIEAFRLAEELGLVISTSEYNKTGMDRTKWYTIDYETYEAFMVLWHTYGEPARGGKRKSQEYLDFLGAWEVIRKTLPLPLSPSSITADSGNPLPRIAPTNTSKSSESPTKTNETVENRFVNPAEPEEKDEEPPPPPSLSAHGFSNGETVKAVEGEEDQENRKGLALAIAATYASASGQKPSYLTEAQIRMLKTKFMDTSVAPPVEYPSPWELYETSKVFQSFVGHVVTKQLAYAKLQGTPRVSRSDLVKHVYWYTRKDGWFVFRDSKVESTSEKFADGFDIG